VRFPEITRVLLVPPIVPMFMYTEAAAADAVAFGIIDRLRRWVMSQGSFAQSSYRHSPYPEDPAILKRENRTQRNRSLPRPGPEDSSIGPQYRGPFPGRTDRGTVHVGVYLSNYLSVLRSCRIPTPLKLTPSHSNPLIAPFALRIKVSVA
jgi:hypothetical protein